MTYSMRKRVLPCIVFLILILVVLKSYDVRYSETSHTPSKMFHNLFVTKKDIAHYKTNCSKVTLMNVSVQGKIEFKNVSFTNEVVREQFDIRKCESESDTVRSLFVKMADINKSTSNIFFVESRCSTNRSIKDYSENRGFVLNPRQSCAVESTAFTNPDRPVFVFHSCPLGDDFLQHSPPFATHLFSYPNVHVVRLNHTELFYGSPVQQLFQERLLENSSHPVEHSSDIIRLVLLWKFGGTYCDLDVVTLRPLRELRTNWAAEEDDNAVATGVMDFEPEGAAHEMLQEMLEHLNQHYDGKAWSSNGPLLLTSFIIKKCNVSQVTDAVAHCILNFTVYEKHVLYPIHYSEVHRLFDHHLGHQTLRSVMSRSFSVHLWNKISHQMSIVTGSTQGYALLADRFCPKVYRNCGTLF